MAQTGLWLVVPTVADMLLSEPRLLLLMRLDTHLRLSEYRLLHLVKTLVLDIDGTFIRIIGQNVLY